jgi:hypothetical protein
MSNSLKQLVKLLSGFFVRFVRLTRVLGNAFLRLSILRMSVFLGTHLTRRRLVRGEPRSLWGVTPILTLPLKAKADRALTFRSDSLVFQTYYISQEFDINLNRWSSLAGRFGLQVLFDYSILSWALLRYDVFHYFYDRGLMCSDGRMGVNQIELDILRAAGKRVYLYAYGADVRRREETLALGKWNFCTECPNPGLYCACSPDQAPRIARIASKATASLALGDMLTYIPNVRNMHYWPIDTEKLPDDRKLELEPTGPFKIAHAPNHSHFKGSHYLESVIQILQSEGHPIEYVRVQGIPNTEVLSVFRKVDLVADQFIGGAFGYTALEAMALGKPVLTYVRAAFLVETPEECPLINTTPDTLLEVLRWCIENRALLQRIGEQGKAYVRRWHSTEAMAARLGQLYEDTAGFPEPTLRHIRQQRLTNTRRRDAIASLNDWQHPYTVLHAKV